MYGRQASASGVRALAHGLGTFGRHPAAAELRRAGTGAAQAVRAIAAGGYGNVTRRGFARRE
jgi:hypothetical protein